MHRACLHCRIVAKELQVADLVQTFHHFITDFSLIVKKKGNGEK
jgi:hypothetical protein